MRSLFQHLTFFPKQSRLKSITKTVIHVHTVLKKKINFLPCFPSMYTSGISASHTSGGKLNIVCGACRLKKKCRYTNSPTTFIFSHLLQKIHISFCEHFSCNSSKEIVAIQSADNMVHGLLALEMDISEPEDIKLKIISVAG